MSELKDKIYAVYEGNTNELHRNWSVSGTFGTLKEAKQYIREVLARRWVTTTIRVWKDVTAEELKDFSL